MKNRKNKKNILIIYSCLSYSLRATTWEHFNSFRYYSSERVFYLNLAYKKVPWYIKCHEFDLIIFHTLFFTSHWIGLEAFNKLLNKALVLKNVNTIKVMIPQDEFINSELYCDFIKKFKIKCVFSVAPENTWKNIYSNINFENVKIFHVLNGYLDDRKLPYIKRLSKSMNNRVIDIGYRTAGKPLYWFGRHGFLKEDIAKVFLEKAPSKGLKIDISTENKDVVLGKAWYRFLANCKYTIGVESGTSMIDPSGSIKNDVEKYLDNNPTASFEEVESSCFPHKDGSCNVFAVSPRHLEACATRTCQVLTKGEYGNILKPGKHYIELEKDFSNIDEVLDVINNDKERMRIINCAYNDIVLSGEYTNSKFVEVVLKKSLNSKITTQEIKNDSPRKIVSQILWIWMEMVETIQWMGLFMASLFIKVVSKK